MGETLPLVSFNASPSQLKLNALTQATCSAPRYPPPCSHAPSQFGPNVMNVNLTTYHVHVEISRIPARSEVGESHQHEREENQRPTYKKNTRTN